MSVKLGVKNFLMVGIMAVLFIVLFKVISNKFPNPVTPVANMV